MTALARPGFRRPRWLSVPMGIGLAVVGFWLLATVLAPAMTIYDPLDLVGRRLQAPGWEHWLGTDVLGRDVLSRTLHGARNSLPIAVIVVTLAVIIGGALGAVSGYVGGLTGAAIMRLVDITLSFPPMLLAMAVAAWLRRSRFGAQLMAVRENEDAAAALGIDIVFTKTGAFSLSGGFAALGGVVYCQTYLFVDPLIAFGVERSVEMLLVAMIGGAGTVWGPVLGALALHLVADTARSFIATPGFAPMLYGVMLLVIVGLLPGGVASLGARWRRA